MTVLEFLIRTLQPKYIGYQDQYKALLYAMNIDPDMDMRELRYKLGPITDQDQT